MNTYLKLDSILVWRILNLLFALLHFLHIFHCTVECSIFSKYWKSLDINLLSLIIILINTNKWTLKSLESSRECCKCTRLKKIAKAKTHYLNNYELRWNNSFINFLGLERGKIVIYSDLVTLHEFSKCDIDYNL